MKEFDEEKRLELAVYGKGGIGKSTISANLSAAMALNGKRVLQIGCDPKHDSTRLLLYGQRIPTVLDHLRDIPEEQAQVSEILHEGFCGVGCIEAGGPKPGVGCAGRGIISAFEFLSKNKIKKNYDAVIYDVLGDVVCGGFAVPVRREYANTVVLVTSGEFMAIYAANNILHGIRNFDGDQHQRVAGIVYNARNLAGEKERVERFAKAVKLPILACIPRSEAFAEAEEKNIPLFELEGYEKEKQIFNELAEKLTEGRELFPACPLDDEKLEEAVLGEKRYAAGCRVPEDKAETDAGIAAAGLPYFKEESGSVLENGSEDPHSCRTENAAENGNTDTAAAEKLSVRRMPLYGCAFNGAAVTAVFLTDAIVIAHSPNSCAFFAWQTITSAGRKGLFNRGILLPSAISPRFACTEITRTEAVYGGTEKLREAVARAVAQKPGAVIVISSCVSGIIGDDLLSVEDLSTEEVPVIAVPADGDIAGDYMKGIQMCLHALAKHLIRTDIKEKTKSVNLIGEVSLSTNLETSYRILKDLLKRLGIAVNCRFLGGAAVSDVKGFMKAPLNILASENADNLALKQWLTEEYGCTFFDMALPTGFEETTRFTRKIADFFGCADKVPAILQEEEEKYKESIERLKPVLFGKRLLMTTISTGLDWLFSAAADAGMKVVWVGVADYLHQGLAVSRNPEILNVSEYVYDLVTAEEKIRELKPDIVVSNYPSAFSQGDYVLDFMPMTETQGFSSGIYALERWAGEFEHRRKGDWTNDRKLYQKYFS
ncbi:MAG: AAA family ATPase [Lachnospiraceae bacterium]|nr:AAA family ATPase [Lachnospiraceae bacterium]